jgi:hypothetical protein
MILIAVVALGIEAEHMRCRRVYCLKMADVSSRTRLGLSADLAVDRRRLHCKLNSLGETGPLSMFDPAEREDYGYV